MKIQTPWGMAQSETELAEGIISYSTAGHGGIWLSKARRRELIERVGKIDNFLHDMAWWEEDCDWAIPYVVFVEDIQKHGTVYEFEKNLQCAKKIISIGGIIHPCQEVC